jgi:hypothetical protein
MPFLLLCLLLLAAVDVTGGQAVVRPDSAGIAHNWFGTWSARTSSGRTFMGTWTAIPDSTTGTVTGQWTLTNAQGKAVATGAWSAAKSPERWTGGWRAVVAGRAGEHSGTWTAAGDLEVDRSFVDLFERAVEAVVSGNWRAGGQAGAWSIRARKRDGR